VQLLAFEDLGCMWKGRNFLPGLVTTSLSRMAVASQLVFLDSVRLAKITVSVRQ
jgi:hypothetical protein